MGDQGYAYTLDEALLTIGFGKFQVGVLAYAGLGWIVEAMGIMILSFVGPAIQSKWGLSSSQESLISTVAFGGMLVGAYSWGVVSDSYGRKKGFLGSTIITGVAGLLSAFAPNYISLLILRCIVGVGIGCGHVFSSWFLEFVPAPNRGSWMVVFSTFWTVGTIMEASLAWWIMPTYGWRWLLGLSAVPSLVALLCYGLVPESPRYLCSQGRLIEARYIFANGATLNCKDLPKGLLVSDHINESTNEGASTHPHETKTHWDPTSLMGYRQLRLANSSEDLAAQGYMGTKSYVFQQDELDLLQSVRDISHLQEWKDAICHQCGDVGHWRRNLSMYLTELIEIEEAYSGASASAETRGFESVTSGRWASFAAVEAQLGTYHLELPVD
ncbi:organic cation/carnitine transporter 7-like protein [Tanacetum coccineum]